MQLLWHQFRRLFLGTVVEALLDAGLSVQLSSLKLDFHDTSKFSVPRLDNYMRFHGTIDMLLAETPSPAAVAGLQAQMTRAWPELLAVLDIPVGDRLTQDRNEVRLELAAAGPEGQPLRVRFDLVAD
jgi:hypothetical protein